MTIFAGLAAVTVAKSVADYKSLNDPVVLALENSIETSVSTIQPPQFNYGSGDSNEGLRRISYDVQKGIYEESKEVFQKIWLLQTGVFDELREIIIQDVLKAVQVRFKTASVDETKRNIIEACEGVYADAKPALATADAIKDGYERKAYLDSHPDLMRLAKLATFCKFL